MRQNQVLVDIKSKRSYDFIKGIYKLVALCSWRIKSKLFHLYLNKPYLSEFWHQHVCLHCYLYPRNSVHSLTPNVPCTFFGLEFPLSPFTKILTFKNNFQGHFCFWIFPDHNILNHFKIIPINSSWLQGTTVLMTLYWVSYGLHCQYLKKTHLFIQ